MYNIFGAPGMDLTGLADFVFLQVESGCNLVNGHRAPVNSIAFSHFRPSMMATGEVKHGPCWWRHTFFFVIVPEKRGNGGMA